MKRRSFSPRTYQRKGNDSINAQLKKPIIPVFQDSNPLPEPIDQFAPFLNRKLAAKKNREQAHSSLMNMKDNNAKLVNTSPFLTTTSASPNVSQKVSKHVTPQNSGIWHHGYSSHIEREKLFDSIAAGSHEKPLNMLTESSLISYFDADNVYFFHDVPSLSSLYCPSLSITIPYGSGIVGYCHFSRSTLSIEAAENHASYLAHYDSKTCQNNSRLLVFPLFDQCNHIRAIIQIVRSSTGPIFTDEDISFVDYFQEKFKLYSRWIFQPIITDESFAELSEISRIPEFVLGTSKKLCKLFNCKYSELWCYTENDQYLKQFISNNRKPHDVPLSDGGIAGFSLTNRTMVSVLTSSMHSAYSPNVDLSGDQSCLVLPIVVSEEKKVYAIVLRGKRRPSFFTDIDEKLLSRISRFVITALRSSELLEKGFDNLDYSLKSQERLQSLLDVAQTLSGQLEIGVLIPNILTKACELVKADRCSLFMFNENREKLITFFHGGLANPIEIPIESGIVGQSAKTGTILNIKDAYADDKFNKSTDKETGYKTNNLLCVPIKNEEGTIIGVTEMINKIGGTFDKDDEQIINVFNVFCAISLENARLYRASIDMSLQLKTILEISHSIAQTNAFKQVISTIISNSRKVIGAGCAIVFLYDSSSKTLSPYAIDEDIDSKARLSDGDRKGSLSGKQGLMKKILVGAKKGNIIENENTEEIRKRILSIALSNGNSTIINDQYSASNSIIAVPLLGRDNTLQGVFVMQWKKSLPGFSKDDLKMLESFSVFISIALERGTSLNNTEHKSLNQVLKETFDENEQNSTELPQRFMLPQWVLSSLFSLSFPSLEYEDPYFFGTIYTLMKQIGVLSTLCVSNGSFFAFMYKLSQSIGATNMKIAVDSVQFLALLLADADIGSNFTPIEKYCMIISVLCSNCDLNNYSEHLDLPLGLIFENKNVSGTHLCSTAISLISNPQYNIMQSFSSNEVDAAWRILISLILSSHISKHFEIMYETTNIDQWTTVFSQKLKVMKLLVKTSISSDLAREQPHFIKRYTFLTDLFFDFGEIDKDAFVQYKNSLKSRATINRALSAPICIKQVYLPLFQRFTTFFPSEKMIETQVMSNLESVFIQ